MPFDFFLGGRHIWHVIPQDLGKQLAQQRRARHLTQRALAAAAGVSMRSLQRLEAGDGGVALKAFLRTLAALGLEAHLRRRGRPTLDELADLYGETEDDDR